MPGHGLRPDRDAKGCSRFPDLHATVHCDETPEELIAELPDRYSSCFSVAEFFRIYDNVGEMCACEIEQPRHVVLFSRKRGTVSLLNRLIEIEPESLDRVAAAIFRAFPGVMRIRAEVKFPPALLGHAWREAGTSEDLVIELPPTLDEYRASLGKRTRQNVNQYSNRLHRTYPDFELKVLEREEIPYTLVAQTAAWNRVRIVAKGDESIYEGHPEKLQRLWKILQTYGIAICGQIGGETVAAQLVLNVGRDTWVHTVGFDSRYEDVHLGLLMAYFTVAESIARKSIHMHMLWGTPIYKQRLGAVPVIAHEVSLFRSNAQKALYVAEVYRDKDLGHGYRFLHDSAVNAAMKVRRRVGQSRAAADENAQI